jgi:hypothetical protein
MIPPASVIQIFGEAPSVLRVPWMNRLNRSKRLEFGDASRARAGRPRKALAQSGNVTSTQMAVV